MSSDSVLSFGRANGLIVLFVHSLPVMGSLGGAALRMTLSVATFANAQPLAAKAKANAAAQYFACFISSLSAAN